MSVDRTIQSGELDGEYITQASRKRLDQELLYAGSVTPGNLPYNMGSTLRWTLNAHMTAGPDPGSPIARDSRYIALTGSAGEVTYADRAQNEGTWQPTTVEKIMDYYGEFIAQRKVDYDWMPKSTKDDLADSVGYAGSETLNGLVRAVVDGSGNASPWDPLQGTGTTNVQIGIWGVDDAVLDLTDKLSAEDLYILEGNMSALNVRRFDDGYYRVFCHPSAIAHLKTNTDPDKASWLEINKYVGGSNAQTKLIKDAVGAIGSVMVYRTTDVTTGTVVTVDYYNNIALGVDGVGGARLGDMDSRVFINNSDASSIDDPYRMFMTTSYRLKACYEILRPEAAWIMRTATGTTTP